MAEMNREKELVLAPNEFAFVSDKTKGNVQVYVGPHKASLSATDSPVIFNEDRKKFIECMLEQAIQNFTTAPEGWYIILKNPAKNGNHPTPRTNNDLLELEVGKKVMIPGPVTFPLWPGQMSRIVEGHRLRSNQYLIVRVYDAEEVMRAADKVKLGDGEKPLKQVVNGDLFVIKGTDASFYIPITGLEVVPYYDNNEEEYIYVRDAVTLERLEYCILLDEGGNKKYIIGPDVVFPSPTEVFIENRNRGRKFKAIELNDTSGIYVKVIAEYDDVEQVASEEGPITKVIKHHNVGEELFITGKDQMIYYPRPEHATIKYGDQTIHYAVAIPEGEARYVLNKNTGEIRLEKGPCMFLPDPRSEVIVKRVLDTKVSSLWFPGNLESLKYNESLSRLVENNAGYITDEKLTMTFASMSNPTRSANSGVIKGDNFDRKVDFTPPRAITLNTKYDGAVTINVFTGYAIQVVNKSGNRKVIVGPASYLLEYDEVLEVMELSTSNPKNTDNLLKTVYLRVTNNKVSDTISVETKDFCQARVKVSYSLNFEGDPTKWFMSENYVKLLCDRMRSMVRREVKQYTIEEFYANSIDIVRKIILGTAEANAAAGRKFAENDMFIYDVDVLDTVILDPSINACLVEAQRKAMIESLNLAAKKRELDIATEESTITQAIGQLEHDTILTKNKLIQEQISSDLAVSLAKVSKEQEVDAKTAEKDMAKAAAELEVNKVALQKLADNNNADLTFDKQKLELYKDKLVSEVKAMVDQHQAISPELIAALQAIGDKHLLETLAKEMAPLAILGGDNVVDAFGKLLANTDGTGNFMAGLVMPGILGRLGMGKVQE